MILPPTPWSNRTAVRHDQRAATSRCPLYTCHDALQEQPGGLRGAQCARVGVEDVALFLAPEGRVGEYDRGAVAALFRQAEGQRVAAPQLGPVYAVEQQVHLGQQKRQRLLLEAADGLADGPKVSRAFGLLHQVLVHLDKEAAGPRGWV